MKDAEDEAFDEIAKKQGAWGGGYQAKRAMAANKFCDANCVWTDHHPDCNMAADKLHWSDCAVNNGPAYPAGECDCGAWQRNNWRCGHGWLRGEQCEICNAVQEPPSEWAVIKTILDEYGLQAIDFVADFKAALAQPAQELEREALNVSATVFVYLHYKNKTIKAEYYSKAKLLEDSADWEHIATINPRMWIECHYAEVEALAQDVPETGFGDMEQPAQEPIKLRRGDILRCIETDELCTVWSSSTTGKTLVKWRANDFGDYTAEQIGELFWLEPKPVQEPVAYVTGVYGGRFTYAPLNPAMVLPTGIALYSTPQHTTTWVGLTDDEIDAIKNECKIGWNTAFARAIESKLKEKNT